MSELYGGWEMVVQSSFFQLPTSQLCDVRAERCHAEAGLWVVSAVFSSLQRRAFGVALCIGWRWPSGLAPTTPRRSLPASPRKRTASVCDSAGQTLVEMAGPRCRKARRRGACCYRNRPSSHLQLQSPSKSLVNSGEAAEIHICWLVSTGRGAVRA